MKIGFNMLLWTARVGEEHRPIIEDIKRTGYDGIEVPVFEGQPGDYAALGRLLDEIGLERTSVTVIPSVEMNPIGADREQRRKAVEYMSWVIDCSAALGATVLCGPLHSTLGHFSGSGPTPDERRHCIEFHHAVGDKAKASGVRVAVEPLNRFECYFLNTMESLARYLDEVNHPSITGMHDTFHANIEEKSPVGCLAEFGRHVSHVHISENDRGTPGKGHVDWPGVFRVLKSSGYEGWLTIEAFGRALPDLAAATRVWRDFFPDPEEVYRVGFRTIRDGWANA